ncbi:hypothetical protein Tco_1369143 [Tanacetum coccineum]
MSSPKFAETHNLVAFLEKPEESNGFEGIIDFLNASSIKYALTVNPTVYESCIEQFWTTAKVKTVNGERQIQALVDKKKLTLMGYENLTQKLTFYKAYFSPQWKFLIHTILQCLSAKKQPGMNLVALWHLLSYHTKKVFANTKMEGKGFSGRVTPLFQSMMVQASEDMGEDSAASCLCC